MLGLGGVVVATAALSVPKAFATGRDSAPDVLGDRFDLADSGARLIREKTLHHATVMQSFAFDEVHGHVYALQLIPSGVQLPGESRTYSHTERHDAGDLCLNRLSMRGEVLGRMYLKGFGHGTAISVDSSRSSWGGGVTLWVECDANPASGYGRAIGRFPYAENTVLHSADRRVTAYRAHPGSSANCAALDLNNRRLLLRYALPDRRRFALYNLDAFTAGVFRPLIDFAQPGLDLGLPFQGMTLDGDYAYQLMGSGRAANTSAEPDNTVLLHCIDLRTGAVVQEHKSKAGHQLTYREPEGLAVLHGPRAKEPQLCMGFASGPAGGRKFSLYGLPTL